ncbi:MAG: PHP domain-containing protein [Candidatus Eisenbacteria bacterium]
MRGIGTMSYDPDVILRVELHMHTRWSDDSGNNLEDIERIAAERDVDVFAVTDHDTIEGALRLRDRKEVKVIVGEEISTAFGDVIGLFLERPVPPGLSPEETMEAIHEQGGLVYIPHPFDRKRKTRLFKEAIDRCSGLIDLFEVWNGRVLHEEDNVRAARYGEEWGLVPVFGSDAHLPPELGRVLMEIGPYDSPAEFLDRVRGGRPILPGPERRGNLRDRLRGLFGGDDPGGVDG